MRRKDMQPGVLYAIGSKGQPLRPGLIHDASTERIRARVYWTWPGTIEVIEGGEVYHEVDYLNPNPDILDPRSKFDERVVKTGDVLMEWAEYAVTARAAQQERLQARLDRDAQEAADREAAIAENTARIEALRPLLQDTTGYLGIDYMLKRVAPGDWTRDYYSLRDVVTMLEQAAAKTFGMDLT